tara:strand:+ start:9034 stop:9321 length:288 start_codon:yes stop_codon:yes gene_type:complete
LTISVDTAGEINYNCDWDSSEEGIIGISAILYKLMLSDLSIKIFDEIKAQCVLDDNEQDFLAIEETIRRYSAIDGKTGKEKDDDIVVPPDEIINL